MASEPWMRLAGFLILVISPMKLLRLAALRMGKLRVLNSVISRMSWRFCCTVLPKPRPGSIAICDLFMPAFCAFCAC